MLVEQYLREHISELDAAGIAFVGEVVSRWSALRHLSLSIARMLERGEVPAVQSALVKEMGTRFEQEVLRRTLEVSRRIPSLMADSEFEQLLCRAMLIAPSFTIRGGTNEILRGIIGKGLRG